MNTNHTNINILLYENFQLQIMIKIIANNYKISNHILNINMFMLDNQRDYEFYQHIRGIDYTDIVIKLRETKRLKIKPL